jgi:hypothetical protein
MKYNVKHLICGHVAGGTTCRSLPAAVAFVEALAKENRERITLTPHGEVTSKWSYQVLDADAAYVIELVK